MSAVLADGRWYDPIDLARMRIAELEAALTEACDELQRAAEGRSTPYRLASECESFRSVLKGSK